MKKEITVNGKSVRIQSEGNALWICLNDVIALLGEKKNPANWLRNKRAQSCLKHLSEKFGRPVEKLVKTVQGGTDEQKGTWCSHSIIMIEVSEWCSVYAQFAKDHMVYLSLNGKTREEAAEDLKKSHPAAYAFACLTIEMGKAFGDTSFFAPLELDYEQLASDFEEPNEKED